jgi:hypothetical protein
MPALNTRIRSTHSNGGGIVMDIDRGKMFSLNASGSAMFELIAKGFDDEAIIDELRRRYEIPAAVAKQDLGDFRKALHGHALLPVGEAASQE